MERFSRIKKIRSHCSDLNAQGNQIGFVPTMGYLHEGHLSLIRRSKKECSKTVVSIFVNPTQFSPEEDFSGYPRDLKNDADLLKDLDVDVLFAPPVKEMYPVDFQTAVRVNRITGGGEGASRPRHFQGVTTVVTKLLNSIQPSVLYLGQKDIQQAIVIRTMIRDLNIPVTVRVCPTIREKDGLALSSRNVYLSDKERQSALSLVTSLRNAEKIIKNGETSCTKIVTAMKSICKKYTGVQLDYVACFDYDTFEEVETVTGRTVIAIAANVGKTRLIDNVIVKPAKK